MRTKEECLQEAEWCEMRATTTTNDELRRTFEQIAQRWRVLAMSYANIPKSPELLRVR